MSNRIDADKELFEMVEVFGHPMLFTCLRINRDTVPKGMHAYDVRHDDYGRGDPCEIAKNIMVNHWGTLITNQQIRLTSGTGNPGRLIDAEKDWCYTGEHLTLSEYIKRYPPQKEKHKDAER